MRYLLFGIFICIGLSSCGSDGVSVYSVEKKTIPKSPQAQVRSETTEKQQPHLNRPYDHVLPEGWIELPASGMRLVSLTVDHSAGKLDGSLVKLGSGGRSILDNVNRWRGQVKLDQLTREELDQTIEKLSTPLGDAHMVTLTNQDHAESAILAAIILIPEGALFAKVMGPLNAIVDNQAKFRAWVNSLAAHSH